MLNKVFKLHKMCRRTAEVSLQRPSFILPAFFILFNPEAYYPKRALNRQKMSEKEFLRVLLTKFSVTGSPSSPGLCSKLHCSSRSLHTVFTKGKNSVNICLFEVNLIQSSNMYFQYIKEENYMGLFFIRVLK